MSVFQPQCKGIEYSTTLKCDLSAKDDDITLGYVHLSSAKLTKGIAIFYAKTSVERSLNISKVSAYYKIACQQNDELLTINY